MQTHSFNSTISTIHIQEQLNENNSTNDGNNSDKELNDLLKADGGDLDIIETR